MPITVFKIGGSLLDLPDLAARIERLIAARPETIPLLVVGGGPAADIVRRWDEIHRLGEARSHWLAIRSLGLNESLCRELLPRCVAVVTRSDILREAAAERLPLLHAEAFLRADDSHADALPHSWAVTSDSIAARAAICFEADELVLAKSVSLPDGDASAVRAAGLVDEHFAQLAAQIPRVGWVDLRQNATIAAWLNDGRPADLKPSV